MSTDPTGAAPLLPCPFCGGEASASRSEDESLWSHNIVWWSTVRCSNCDVQMVECDDPNGVKAAASWNQRSDRGTEGATAPSSMLIACPHCSKESEHVIHASSSHGEPTPTLNRGLVVCGHHLVSSYWQCTRPPGHIDGHGNAYAHWPRAEGDTSITPTLASLYGQFPGATTGEPARSTEPESA